MPLQDGMLSNNMLAQCSLFHDGLPSSCPHARRPFSDCVHALTCAHCYFHTCQCGHKVPILLIKICVLAHFLYSLIVVFANVLYSLRGANSFAADFSCCLLEPDYWMKFLYQLELFESLSFVSQSLCFLVSFLLPSLPF